MINIYEQRINIKSCVKSCKYLTGAHKVIQNIYGS